MPIVCTHKAFAGYLARTISLSVSISIQTDIKNLFKKSKEQKTKNKHKADFKKLVKFFGESLDFTSLGGADMSLSKGLHLSQPANETNRLIFINIYI